MPFGKLEVEKRIRIKGKIETRIEPYSVLYQDLSIDEAFTLKREEKARTNRTTKKCPPGADVVRIGTTLYLRSYYNTLPRFDDLWHYRESEGLRVISINGVPAPSTT